MAEPGGRLHWPAAGNSQKKMGTDALLVLLKFFVFFSKTFDAAGRIHQLLFAGKKRMAFGANFHANVLFRGSNLHRGPAGTLDGCIEIIRMDVSFHFYFNPL
jgi:hypothetical protein